MAVSSAYTKVWVMAFTGGVPTWDSSQWSVENRLIPIRSVQTNGSMGEASFRLLRSSRQDDNGAAVLSSWDPIKGQYVAITTQACTLPGSLGSLWVGYVEDFQKITTRNNADAIGTVTARQLGGVLDQVPLANPRIFDLTGVSADGIALLTIPTANADGLTQGEVIGNAVDAPAGVQPGGYTRRQWAGKAADCGSVSTNFWSRWSLLDHFTHWNYSPLLPTLALSATSNVQTLLDTAAKEVFRLQGLTLKGLMDLMCGGSRGLRWWISYSGNTWTLNVISAIDVAVGAIPAATLTPVILANDVSVRLVTSGFDNYDAVEVNGAPIVFGGTISPIDGTATNGWSASSLTAYKAGASGAAGYGALTTSQQIARNRAVRKSGLLADVFTRYVVAQDTTYQFQCKNVAGVPVAGSVQFFCPLVSWSGTVATINNATNMCPYPPEARLLRQLPWQEGVQGDGTDLRDPEQKAKPKYLTPIALSYQIPGEATWSDLCHPPFARWHAAHMHADSRGPATRIEFDYPEMLGFADWTGSPAITEYDPTATTQYGASDWRKLVMTVAMQSDQRVKVVSYKSGVSSTTYRNPLRVNRPDLNCWVMRAHTIIGLKADGSPDEVATDAFVRNDFAVAQKLADELAAFAFRKRTGAVITITQPWAPPAWASLLATISTLTEPNGAVTYPLNTPVTSIEQVWDERSPRLVITTGDPPMPESTAFVPMAPAFGGVVSTALGCTLPAMVQRIDADVKEVQRAQERVPIITGRLPAPASALSYSITQTAHGFSVGNVVTFGGTWLLATPNVLMQYGDQLTGIVLAVPSTNTFTLAVQGVFDLSTFSLSGLAEYYIGTSGNLVFLTSVGVSTLSVRRLMVTTNLDQKQSLIHGPQAYGGHEHANIEAVAQTGHGFTAGQVVSKTSGATWALASKSSYADILGVVTASVDANNFLCATGGMIYLTSGTPGTIYSLGATAGLLDGTFTSASIPVLYQLDAHRAFIVTWITKAASKISDPTHGNTRGTDVTDLQNTRTANTMVASGSYAVLPGGQNNTASGNWTFCVGYNCVASGSGSFAAGYSNTASQASAIAIGNASTASAAYATALGKGATAGGQGALAISTGDGSASNGASATGTYSFAIGRAIQSTSINAGVLGYAVTPFADSGDNTLTLYYASGVFITGVGGLTLNTAGAGLSIKSGTNARCGTATLVAGTVTVANTSVTANTRIFVTVKTAGGTQGFLRTVFSVNTSFSISSTSATETSVVAWLLVENP